MRPGTCVVFTGVVSLVWAIVRSGATAAAPREAAAVAAANRLPADTTLQHLLIHPVRWGQFHALACRDWRSWKSRPFGGQVGAETPLSAAPLSCIQRWVPSPSTLAAWHRQLVARGARGCCQANQLRQQLALSTSQARSHLGARQHCGRTLRRRSPAWHQPPSMGAPG
jgi:hypothetical protein